MNIEIVPSPSKRSVPATLSPSSAQDAERLLGDEYDAGPQQIEDRETEQAIASRSTEEAPAAEPEPTEREIVRATCRIQIELSDLAEDKKAHIKKLCGGVEKCAACRARRDLEDTRRRCVTAMNAATRTYWRLDADSLDAYLAEHGELPKKGKDWPLFPTKVPHPGYVYPLIRRLAPELNSNIAATLQKQSLTKWCQERWEAMIWQQRSPPHYRQTLPIPIPRQSVKFQQSNREGHDADDYLITFSLLAGGEGRYTMPVRARDGWMRERFRLFTEHPEAMGAIMLEQDRLRSGRWFVRMSYTRVVPIAPKSGVKIALNLGMTVFLAACTSKGERWLYDGHDLLAFLKQMQKRRRQYQNDSKASMRWGHGRNRTLVPIDKLTGKAERWRETRNQGIARSFVAWCVDHGVIEIILGDFTGIRDGLPEKLKGGKYVWDLVQEWPYFDLQTRIVSCAEELGLHVKTLGAEKISQTCTVCGHVDALSVKLRRRIHECTKCQHQEHLDISACKVLLQREGAGVAPKVKKKSRKQGKKPPPAAPAGDAGNVVPTNEGS